MRFIHTLFIGAVPNLLLFVNFVKITTNFISKSVGRFHTGIVIHSVLRTIPTHLLSFDITYSVNKYLSKFIFTRSLKVLRHGWREAILLHGNNILFLTTHSKLIPHSRT